MVCDVQLVMSVMVSDGQLVMSVTVCDGQLVMSVTVCRGGESWVVDAIFFPCILQHFF